MENILIDTNLDHTNQEISIDYIDYTRFPKSNGDNTVLYKEGAEIMWDTWWIRKNWWVTTATYEKRTGVKATQWDD